MAWLKIETHTPDKPEIFDMARQLGLSPDDVFGKCFRLWTWFDAHTTNGETNGVGVSSLLVDRICGVTGFAEAMSNVGWLHGDSENYRIANFDRHNGETAKTRAQTAKRVSKHANAKLTQTPLPREEKRREEVNLETLSGKPDALPPEKIKLSTACGEILTFLNEKTGRNYRPVKANIDMIAARLKDGATVAECRQIIAKKTREWGADEKMAEYLRPKTLFNRTNFANYQGELT